jgi:peroxiredoxin
MRPRPALTAAAAALTALIAISAAPPRAQSGSDLLGDPTKTLTRVGQAAPAFRATALDGGVVGRDTLRGRVAVVFFWATWCPACRTELPRLETEVWKAHRSPRFALVAIAREETGAEVRPFRDRHRYTMPMALDPERTAFDKFATEGIPRTYVLSPEGRILFQSVGYDEEEFAAMKTIIARELQHLKPPSAAGGRGR